jgi:hypothetical protein
MLQELELGLRPVKAFEVEEKFFDDFRTSGEANPALRPTSAKGGGRG